MREFAKPLKQKKCKECKEAFTPARPLQLVCSPVCAGVYARRKTEQKQRKEDVKQRKERRDAKERAKTRGDWLKEAQKAFNAFIRARDAGLPCISCDKPDIGARDASHYRARSVAPALRFHEDNCHASCIKCNQHLHGNLLEYRIRLIRKIGLERVEFLEGPQEPKHYSIEDLKEIKAKYMGLVKELNRRKDDK